MSNRTPLSRACLLGLALALAAPLAQAVKPADSATLPAPDAALQAAIAGSWRDPANTARDPYRHPGQTLAGCSYSLDAPKPAEPAEPAAAPATTAAPSPGGAQPR